MSGGALTDYGGSSIYTLRQWAREIEIENPLLAEMLRDQYDLLVAYDYYLSGDSGHDRVEKAWKEFSEKWLSKDPEVLGELIMRRCERLVESTIKGYTGESR